MASPFAFLALLLHAFVISSSALESYIVYLGNHHYGMEPELIASSHQDMLTELVGSASAAQESIIYSYKHSFNGFAAFLEEEHVSYLSALPEVVSVFPNRAHQLHTTRSWEFLGLEEDGFIPKYSLWKKADFGRDVIIGLFDTGVWPESASFRDDGMGPVPSRWKGVCQNGTMFNTSNCNRKLIGAQYFIKGNKATNGELNETKTGDFLSPRDKEGHGTHTASTAGGMFVKGANVFGFGHGTSKGGAPHSRIAIYKVCWTAGCYDADILAAFDAAIHDGVDILSLSLGSGLPLPQLFADGIAIGSLHAAQKGILVVCSAGNDGPQPSSVANVAPWILTVAANSMDREFPSYAILGNKKAFKGSSLSEYQMTNGIYPLVSGVEAKSHDSNVSASQLCFPGSLDPKKTMGKVVACLRGVTARVDKGAVVKQAGGAGMILCNSPANANEIIADPHVLPATEVTATDSISVMQYINSTRSAVAYISPPKTALGIKPSPVMASFSSQGPSAVTPDILKVKLLMILPDITAPGLNILASWTEASAPTSSTSDPRRIPFNIISGTSMSCPHVAGVAALLKALHPEWSPAAIKSAIMTTAYHLSNSHESIINASLVTANPFNYGAGHIHPNAAADPGLVYDLVYEDYLSFICNLKYNQTSLRTLTSNNHTTCPKHPVKMTDLNYPSIALSDLRGQETVTRTVTNVGSGNATYKVVVRPPPGIAVYIGPSQLSFSAAGEKKSFRVIFKVKKPSEGHYVFGHFTWTDGKHRVRSPIALKATHSV